MGRPKKFTITLQPNGNIKKEAIDGVPKGLRVSKQGNNTNLFQSYL
jgi:hypothetical protein